MIVTSQLLAAFVSIYVSNPPAATGLSLKSAIDRESSVGRVGNFLRKMAAHLKYAAYCPLD